MSTQRARNIIRALPHIKCIYVVCECECPFDHYLQVARADRFVKTLRRRLAKWWCASIKIGFIAFNSTIWTILRTSSWRKRRDETSAWLGFALNITWLKIVIIHTPPNNDNDTDIYIESSHKDELFNSLILQTSAHASEKKKKYIIAFTTTQVRKKPIVTKCAAASLIMFFVRIFYTFSFIANIYNIQYGPYKTLAAQKNQFAWLFINFCFWMPIAQPKYTSRQTAEADLARSADEL